VTRQFDAEMETLSLQVVLFDLGSCWWISYFSTAAGTAEWGKARIRDKIRDKKTKCSVITAVRKTLPFQHGLLLLASRNERQFDIKLKRHK
jgi:hypothetical protein